MNAVRRVFLLPVRLYRRILSPLKPPCCRFTPTCSAYTIEAVMRFGILKGSWLTFKRVLRCQPFGGYGEDPVPGHPAISRGDR